MRGIFNNSLDHRANSIRLLLIIVLVFPASRIRAGSIFDDDFSPAAAPRPTQPNAAPGVDAPARPQTQTPPSTGTASRSPEAIAQRRSIPPKSDQTRSRRLFKDIYARELGDRSSTGRAALGRTLMHDAGKMANAPSDQFVLLLGAYEAGKEAANLELCIAAADALADAYDVDGLRLKIDAVLHLPTRSSSPGADVENCRQAMSVLDELIAAEDYTAVKRLVSALRPMGSKDASLGQQLQSCGRDAEALRSGSEELSRNLEKLKISPKESAAALSAGQFLCFKRGDWARGLPLLAGGSDAKLKELASADLANPTESESIEHLGDQWWAVASSQHDLARRKIAQHAAALYSNAVENTKGLRRIQIEKKLDQAVAAGGLTCRKVNLLALIDPARDAIEGEWQLDHGQLVGDTPAGPGRLRIPYHPPEEYDFRIEFTRTGGNTVLQMLSHDHHSFKWLIDYEGHTYGFDFVGGHQADDNPTHLERPNFLQIGERCISIVKIRRNSITTLINGEVFTNNYRTDYSDFSMQQMWDVGNDCLGVGTLGSKVIFHVIELTEISGSGKKSPPEK